jgi:hypothetical protein
MNCPELERWLDEGMPETARADALHHVESCAGCAELLAAAGAIEALLREEPAEGAPIVAPPGFTNAVLARVESETKGARVAFPQREPWWVSWALDPVSVVAITAAVVVAAMARLHPAWFLDPGFAWISRSSEWTEVAWTDAAAFFRATARVWLAIGIGLAPLAIWGAAMFVRRLERLVLLLVAR